MTSLALWSNWKYRETGEDQVEYVEGRLKDTWKHILELTKEPQYKGPLRVGV